MAQVKGEFDVKRNPEGGFDLGGGAVAGHFRFDKQFHGALNATGIVHMLAVGTQVDGSAAYVAVERSIAELDDVVAVFEALLRIAEIEAGARRSAFAGIDLVPVLADLAETYAAIDRLEKTEVKTTTYTRWRETFPRVAVPSAVLLAAAALLGLLVFPVTPR